MKIISLAPEVL